MTARSTKTALLAWELGEGLGHVPTLKAVARGLQSEGWRIVFALRDPSLTRTSLAELNTEILPAPFWQKPIAVQQPSYSYTDILAANGFSSARDLRSLIAAWDGVFDAAKPDLLVAEHSPGAVVAAFGRMPVAIVGNGFLVPPAQGADFPSYRPDAGVRNSHAAVLEAMQDAIADHTDTACESVTAPFRAAFRAVYAFPALDPFGAVRDEPVLGPLEPMPALSPLPTGRHVFAYSASDLAMIDELTAALMDLGPKASAYFRGPLGARAAVLKSRGVAIFAEAPQLGSAIGNATCVFSHAGSGVTAAAFAAGRPQILNPRHGEASTTAKLLEVLGVGVTVAPLERRALRDAVERVHSNGDFASSAQRAGEAAQAFVKNADALGKTVSALTAL